MATSYTSKEWITTAAPTAETPEQARARTEATAAQNIAARANPAPVTTPAQTIQQNAQATTPTPAVATVQPVAPTPKPAPTQTAPTTPVASQDSFGTSDAFIKQQQEKLKAANAAQAKPTKAPQVVKADKPLSTAPTTMQKKEAPVIDYNSSVGREAEITNNLNTITAGNTWLTTDRASFDKAFGYATADEWKKALLDSFFQSKQVKPTADAIFTAILQGQTSGFDQTSLEFRYAKSRATNYTKYANMNSSQLAEAMKAGTIVEGSQTYNDLMNNPQAKENLAKAKSLNQINGKTVTNTDAAVTNTMNDIVNTTGIGKAFQDGIITADEMNAMTSSPEIVNKQNELQAKKDAYDKMKREYEDISDAVDAEYKGKNASSSYLAALKAERQKGLLKTLNFLGDEYNNALGTLSSMKKDAADLFSTNLGLYKDQQAIEKAKELARYQQELWLQTKKDEFAQNLQLQADAASDPYTAIKSIMDQYEKLGVPFTESLATKLQNFKNSGQTIGEYTKQMIKDIQSKPEYARIKEMTLGQLSDREKLAAAKKDANYGFQNLGGGIIAVTDPTTGNITFKNAAGWTVSDVVGTLNTDPQAIAEYSQSVRGKTNLQCGQLVNDYWKKATGTKWTMGDSLNSKYETISNIGRSNEPVVGGLFVSNPLGNNVGHTGIVQSINDDGSVVILEANAEGKENGSAPTLRTVNPAQFENYRWSIAPTTEWATGKSYTATQEALLSKYLKDPSNKTVNTAMKQAWLTSKDADSFTEANKWAATSLSDAARVEIAKAKSVFKADPVVKAFEESLQNNRDILVSLSSESGLGDTAAVYQFMKGLDPSSVVRETEFAMAASTAGLADKAKNYFTKLQNWEFLAETSQRKEMERIVNAFLQNRAKSYDRKYNDLMSELDAWGAPSTLKPTSASLELSAGTSGQNEYDSLFLKYSK